MSPVDVLFTDEYPTGAFKLCPLMVTGMIPLCLCGVFRGIFHYCNVMLLFTVPGVS